MYKVTKLTIKWCEMYIDSIKLYPSDFLIKSKHDKMHASGFREKTAEMCKNNANTRGYYGGSFTGINTNRAAATVSEEVKPLLKDNWLDKINKLCERHTVIAQNLVALVLACTLRPLAIMSLPGKKNKDDKIYASGHAISSGLIGFGFSTIVMYPLGKAAAKSRQNVTEVAVAPLLDKDIEGQFKQQEAVIKNLKNQFGGETYDELIENIKNNSQNVEDDLEKINLYKTYKKQLKSLDDLKKIHGVETIEDLIRSIKAKYNINELKDLENVELFKRFKELYNVKDLTKLEQSHAFKMTTKALDMAPDVFIFGIAKAMLTVALIPPILKYGFGVEKKKSAPQPQQNSDAAAVHTQTVSTMPRPEISKFAGGLK